MGRCKRQADVGPDDGVYARALSRQCQHHANQNPLVQGWKGRRQLQGRQSAQKGGYSEQEGKVWTRALILSRTALIARQGTRDTTVIVHFLEATFKM